MVAVKENIITGYLTCDRSCLLSSFYKIFRYFFEYCYKEIGNQTIAFVEEKIQGERLFSSTERDNVAMLNLFNKRKYKISGIIEN